MSRQNRVLSQLEKTLQRRRNAWQHLIAEQDELRIRLEVAAVVLVQCKGFIELCELLQDHPQHNSCTALDSPLWASNTWLSQLRRLRDQLEAAVSDELQVHDDGASGSAGSASTSSNGSQHGGNSRQPSASLWPLNWSPAQAAAAVTDSSSWPTATSLRTRMKEFVSVSSCMIQ